MADHIYVCLGGYFLSQKLQGCRFITIGTLYKENPLGHEIDDKQFSFLMWLFRLSIRKTTYIFVKQ